MCSICYVAEDVVLVLSSMLLVYASKLSLTYIFTLSRHNITRLLLFNFFFSSRRRHTRYIGDWSSDVCSSDLPIRKKGHSQRRILLWPLLDPRQGWVAFTFFSHKILRWLCPFFLIGAMLFNLLLADQPF